MIGAGAWRARTGAVAEKDPAQAWTETEINVLFVVAAAWGSR